MEDVRTAAARRCSEALVRQSRNFRSLLDGSGRGLLSDLVLRLSRSNAELRAVLPEEQEALDDVRAHLAFEGGEQEMRLLLSALLDYVERGNPVEEPITSS